MKKKLFGTALFLLAFFSACLIKVSAAEFSDVPKDSVRYGAINALTELGVISGYGDGTFGPFREITRTEFAALLARTMGYSKESYAVKKLPFGDVPGGYWGEGFISFCYEYGLINGMGNGRFAPAEKVTYEQAVKMTVCAAGKQAEAQSAGGAAWYLGYVTVAEKYGLLKNVDFTAGKNANRENVAQLVYNVKSAGILTEVKPGEVKPSNNAQTPNIPQSPNENGSAENKTPAKPEKELSELEKAYLAKDFTDVKTILVDAGHNHDGKDIGARNDKYGIKEEDITWQIADKLRTKLEAAGYRVIMTRPGIDSSVANASTTESLQARVDMAHKNLADLFISVHCNTGGGKGTETYCFSTGGYAERLAKIVQKNMKEQVGLYDRGVKTANFYVIKNTLMPAILIETGFIDNDSDAWVLTSAEGQEKIAAAVAAAVKEYDNMAPLN